MTTLVLTGCRDDTGLSHEESSSNQAKSSENTTSQEIIDSNDRIQQDHTFDARTVVFEGEETPTKGAEGTGDNAETNDLL